MLIMDAVLETYEAAGFSLWPVAGPSADHLLALSGGMSATELGTAMAVLASCNADNEREEPVSEDQAGWIGRLVTTERVVAPGGLRIRDTTTGVTVSPGCCSGLEDWRDWLDLVNGEEPWLGHDPTPRIDHRGASVRLWPDGDHLLGDCIVLPLVQLPGLLEAVRGQLAGFRAAVEQWTTPYDPVLATRVVTKLDQGLAIGAPLQKARRRDAVPLPSRHR
ncbi:hypothetical protein ACGF7W_33620 [Streptomyces sp. NPDC048219]|uniref:hypothetical protein n=1 Tax=Streptomyces sp. NPDC048219 TaxID=3365517 RepID=UPI003717DEF5